MKKLLLLLLLPGTLWAYQQPKSGSKSTVTLICNIIDLPANTDSLTLYDLRGLANTRIARAGKDSEGRFVFEIPAGEPRLFGVGVHELSVAKLVLGQEPQVTLWANANYLDKARTMGSPVNKGLEDLRKQLDAFKAEEAELLTAGIQSRNAPKAAAENKKAAVDLAKRKEELLNSLKNANPVLYRTASLHIHPDFFAEEVPSGAEAEFISNNFFRNANFKDAGMEGFPEVYDAFKSFAESMLQTGATADKMTLLSRQALAAVPENSASYRLALGGLITGYQSNPAVMLDFTKTYINLYKSQNQGEIARLENEVRKSSVFTAGMEAPDLVGPTPDGGTYALSEMRGKYVLIDFWASWCGPCIREMPNVKASYEKYKDKGFDILGVSLDRDKAAWLRSIESQAIPWKHISDLKGWQSEHAKLYSVNSIPATVLLDKEGKIIARNLRGEALGAKLMELFGE